MKERCLMRIAISYDMIDQFMKKGSKFNAVEVIEGLPQDAVLMSTYTDQEHQQAVFIYSHESFPGVPFGAVIPWHPRPVLHQLPRDSEGRFLKNLASYFKSNFTWT